MKAKFKGVIRQNEERIRILLNITGKDTVYCFRIISFFSVFMFTAPLVMYGQPADTGKMTLQQCIDFALQNQARHQQAQIDEEISHRTVRASLSAWLPQVQAAGNVTHYLKVPATFFPTVFTDPNSPRAPRRFSLPNASLITVEATQTIYSSDALVALRASKYSKLRAAKNTETSKINVIVSVSKAYYDVLTTEQQIVLLNENIQRQQRLYDDTYSQYEAGVVDKIDYKRTSITLNNSLAEKKRAQESLTYKYAYLRQLIGYPEGEVLKLDYSSTNMEQEAALDTLQTPDYKNRVEFQSLQAQKELQWLNVQSYRGNVLPTIAAFANYNFNYQSMAFDTLFRHNYPYYAFGVRATLPIFTGGRRYQNVQIAKLQVQRLEKDIVWFRQQVSSEYAQAMGTYKANLNELRVQKDNLDTANEVYELVKLQYEQGIKPYLDLITSEADLRNTQFNYLNALYNVLESKLEVQRVVGAIK